MLCVDNLVRGLAQLGLARQTGGLKVVGSNPTTPIAQESPTSPDVTSFFTIHYAVSAIARRF